MNEINKIKKLIYYPENYLKIPITNYSNFTSTNRTNNINDSNNKKSNSSLFTNEALIKSIANITTPYNKFYPKMKPILRNALKRQNKTAIKNKLLLTNYSSFNFNRTKSYSNKFFNIKDNLNFRNNSLKDLNKKINILTSKKLDNNNKTQINENELIISNANKENDKVGKKMKLLKFKINTHLKKKMIYLIKN